MARKTVKPKTQPGPEPERFKIDGDWEAATTKIVPGQEARDRLARLQEEDPQAQRVNRAGLAAIWPHHARSRTGTGRRRPVRSGGAGLQLKERE